MRTRTAVDSICTASRRILWICLSIISSAALAGSVERMNRFIIVSGWDSKHRIDVFDLLLYCCWGNIRFNFPIIISKLGSNRVKII
jgi:hypothetical protein